MAFNPKNIPYVFTLMAKSVLKNGHVSLTGRTFSIVFADVK